MDNTNNYLLKFKDFYFARSVTNINLLETLEDFEIRDDNVFIVMYPKSGKFDEWAILHRESLHYLNGHRTSTHTSLVFDVKFHDSLLAYNTQCTMQYVPSLIPITGLSHSPPPPRSPQSVSQSPQSLVVHSPFCLPPLSSMTSYFHFSKLLIVLEDFDNMEDFMERFLDGKGNYEFFVNLWFDHIRGWYEHRHDFNILFMVYEEMKKDLRSAVLKISRFFFFEKELSEEDVDAVVEQATFQNMASDPQINYDYILKDVTKIQVNERIFLCKDWKRHLTMEQNERLDRIFPIKMNDFPLKFIWDLKEDH
uniref:Sulfotransferase n=1 Tax=Ursus americanus TaxID=9643 RepID=A0A452RB37_URSAM